MKYLITLLMLISLNSVGQNHKTEISQYREKYKQDFLASPHSPLKQDDLQYLRFYDTDSTYRVTAQIEYLKDEPVFAMPTFTNSNERPYSRFAKLKFSINGLPLQLTVYKSITLAARPGYKDYLFLPFADETNGVATYGGGRYLDFSEDDFKSNTLIIDFNKAYNPYCAFSNRYACPKPPDENQLNVEIKAGEKMFAKEKVHN